MATVSITYNLLEESSRNAKKLSNKLEDYAEKITRKVISPARDLPANDSRGYVSNATTNASAKIKALNNKAKKFKTYSDNVEKFVSDAKDADKRVEQTIRSTAKSYVGERNWWQAACDAVYNFLFVDFMNSNALTRFIADVFKGAWKAITNFAWKARDWFKYGAGKYVWNIVAGVVAVIGVIIGAVTAIAAVIAASSVGAIIIATIAAVATVISGVIAIINAGIKIYNNGKALAAHEDEPGVARYIGGIGGYSDLVERTDFGNAEDNAKKEKFAKSVEVVKTTCDVIVIVKNFIDLGGVVTSTGKIPRYKFSKKNIMKNIKGKLGYDFKEKKFTFKKMFEFDFGTGKTKRWFANKHGYGGLKFFNKLKPGTKKAIQVIADGSSITKTVMGLFENADTVYGRLQDGCKFNSLDETLKSVESIGYTIIDSYKFLGDVEVFGGINKYIIKPFETIIDIKDDITGKQPEKVELPI